MEQLTLFEISVTGTAEELLSELISKLSDMELDAKVLMLNEIRTKLHEVSPFKAEPVDLITWVKADSVQANDYNPNKVAPPEMELLRHSIGHDGYTQPVVTWDAEDGREVIDGFHRTRVAKECDDVKSRVMGYLPVVTIQEDCKSRNDRIASTIRHNRARGKHQVDAMSDIVVELKNRNWKNARIAKELGMDEDEVLRLCQITGLAGLFSDEDFSKSWDVEDSDYDEFVPLDDSDGMDGEYTHLNTDDPGRIFHTYEKWECAKAGFYKTSFPGKKSAECEEMYSKFLASPKRFRAALKKLIVEWKYSCEHYLTNRAMNRIAWLGQAAMCYATGVPSCFRGGWNLLTEEQQEKANKAALDYLNKWLKSNDMETVTMDEAQNGSKQTVIY
jgi:hypothetical protein